MLFEAIFHCHERGIIHGHIAMLDDFETLNNFWRQKVLESTYSIRS
jgi:5'(3')-deoxyribonucleotidase